MTFLGIDVGGQSIRGGIINKEGKILAKEIVLTEADKGRDVVVSNILKIAKSLLKKDKNITGVGIGIPGIIDDKGYVLYTPNIPLSDYDLGKELKKEIKKKVFFGNDAKNFALAQLYFGLAKGHNTVITLTLGTGVGSGIIIDGKLFSNKGAPELGHTTIKFDAQKSRCCGNDGCIESFIGRRSFGDCTPLELYKRAVVGNKEALKKFSDYGKYLGIAIANFVNIFNPEIIILGGQLSNAYVFFRKTMEEEVQRRSLFKTKIVKNNLREAGMIGSAILAF